MNKLVTLVFVVTVLGSAQAIPFLSGFLGAFTGVLGGGSAGNSALRPGKIITEKNIIREQNYLCS